MSRAPLLAASALCFLAFLALDQAGRPGLFFRAPPTDGREPRSRVVVDAPAGAYQAFVRMRRPGSIATLRVTGPGLDRTVSPPRSASRFAEVDLPLGRIDLPQAAPFAIESSPPAPRGSSEGIAIEPDAIVGSRRDAAQRLAAALCLGTLLLALRASIRRRPALGILLVVAGLEARSLVYGLVPCPQGDRRLAFWPWHVLSLEEIGAGRVPLWNPHAFLGMPHLANMQSQILYPPKLLGLLLGTSYMALQAAMEPLHLLAAGLGTLCLARRIGISRSGSLLGGVLYMLGPAMLNPEQDSMVAAAALLPAILLAALSSWRWLAVALAAGITAGHLQLWSYALLGIGIIVAIPPVPLRGRGARLLAATASGMLLAAALLVPVAESAVASIRSLGLSPEHAAIGALDAAQVEAMLDHGLGSRWIARMPASRNTRVQLAGLVAFPFGAAALADVARRRQRRRIVSILALASAGLLVAIGDLGRFSPYALLGKLPLFQGARGPARALVITMLAVSLLCGRGHDVWRASTRRARIGHLLRATLLLVAGLGVAMIYGVERDRVLPDLAWHAAIAASVLLAGALGRRAVAIPILVLAIADRADDAWTAMPGAWPSEYRIHPAGRRVPPGEREMRPADDNDAILARRRSAWGYDPVVPRRTAMLWDVLAPEIFRFDSRGRLASLHPKLRKEILDSPRGRSLLHDLGVGAVSARAYPAPIHERISPDAAAAVRLLRAPPDRIDLLDRQEAMDPGTPVERLVARDTFLSLDVKSFLKGGRAIAQGTPVARIRALDGERVVLDATLRAGIETADADLDDPALPAAAHRAAATARAFPFERAGRRFDLRAYGATFELPAGAAVSRVDAQTLAAPGGVRLAQLRLRRASAGASPSLAFVVEDPTDVPVGTASAASPRVRDVSPCRVDVDLAPDWPGGYLVLADTFFPGWTASVDGSSQPIVPAQIAARRARHGRRALRHVPLRALLLSPRSLRDLPHARAPP
ncbi:MAG: hypothetical protein U0166_03825 [Acidobacteriota bacterium]